MSPIGVSQGLDRDGKGGMLGTAWLYMLSNNCIFEWVGGQTDGQGGSSDEQKKTTAEAQIQAHD